MKSTWFSYLPIDEVSFRKEKVKKFYDAWELLTEVLNNKLENTSYVPDYKNAAWAYEQAHCNGKKEALKELISLLDIKE